jgi:hypothetical protein
MRSAGREIPFPLGPGIPSLGHLPAKASSPPNRTQWRTTSPILLITSSPRVMASYSTQVALALAKNLNADVGLHPHRPSLGQVQAGQHGFIRFEIVPIDQITRRGEAPQSDQAQRTDQPQERTICRPLHTRPTQIRPTASGRPRGSASIAHGGATRTACRWRCSAKATHTGDGARLPPRRP